MAWLNGAMLNMRCVWAVDMKPWAFFLLLAAMVVLAVLNWDWLVKKWAEAHGVDTSDWED